MNTKNLINSHRYSKIMHLVYTRFQAVLLSEALQECGDILGKLPGKWELGSQQSSFLLRKVIWQHFPECGD